MNQGKTSKGCEAGLSERLPGGQCKVPHFKKEAESRWDKELSVHSEARLLEVRLSQRDAGVMGRGGRNQRNGVFLKWLSRPEYFCSRSKVRAKLMQKLVSWVRASHEGEGSLMHRGEDGTSSLALVSCPEKPWQ